MYRESGARLKKLLPSSLVPKLECIRRWIERCSKVPEVMSLPVGWERFSNYGTTIKNLFLPHKVPLKEFMTRSRPQLRFTTQDLMDRFPNLGMVIDLTQTGNACRYYEPMDLEENGIKHVKITIRGGGFLPPSSQVEEFVNLVDDFNSNNHGKLIGVHCTHGLNRTGFMICNYLIRKYGISGHDALKIFEEARGHGMEREAYVEEILSHSAASNHREPRLGELEPSSRLPSTNSHLLQLRPNGGRGVASESNSSSRPSSPNSRNRVSSSRDRVSSSSDKAPDSVNGSPVLSSKSGSPPIRRERNNAGNRNGAERRHGGIHYQMNRWDTNESHA